jgi:flavin reductase ActVB
MNEMSVDPAAFRAAMSRFPSGVTIVTSTDAQGKPCGFTATAFCSLSLEPPLVLVCLANSARCYNAFCAAESYVIHFADQSHRDLALRFASKSVDDKFEGGGFVHGSLGHPELDDAVVTLRCRAENVVSGGDHAILIGRVVDVTVRDDRTPLIHGDRAFGRLEPHAS